MIQTSTKTSSLIISTNATTQSQDTTNTISTNDDDGEEHMARIAQQMQLSGVRLQGLVSKSTATAREAAKDTLRESPAWIQESNLTTIPCLGRHEVVLGGAEGVTGDLVVVVHQWCWYPTQVRTQVRPPKHCPGRRLVLGRHC